jgi:hypothetical protein
LGHPSPLWLCPNIEQVFPGSLQIIVAGLLPPASCLLPPARAGALFRRYKVGICNFGQVFTIFSVSISSSNDHDFFLWYWGLNQSLVRARQMFYHLSQPFLAFIIFQIGSHVFAILLLS